MYFSLKYIADLKRMIYNSCRGSDLMVEWFNRKCNIAFASAHKQYWTQPSFNYMKICRPNHGIMLVTNGTIEFATSENTICVQKGDVVFLPKNSYYKAVFRIDSGAVDNYLINFEAEGILSGCTKPKLILKNVYSDYFDSFESIFWDSKNTEATLSCNGQLYLLLDSILNATSKTSDTDKLIGKAKKLLLLKENLSINEIARKCCLSESGFRKIFTENAGTSPSVYRNTERILKAKYLLEATDKSVAEISEELGFFDTAYFCKVFKKYEGISPRKYSKNKKL